MAEANQILDLREMINEPTNLAPWTDEALALQIDNWEGSLEALAAKIWRNKAASLSGLIDTREGNSDRKMSQLYKQALDMASSFETDDDQTTARVRRPARTRQIERL